MSIYEHFRKEERPFIDQVLEWKETVKERYVHKLTDFLDPREQQIVKTIIGQDEDIRLAFFGGNITAERKRAFLFPPYLELQDEDFQLAAFQINYPHKFLTLEHRDFLGSLMGLGLKREKFGDINILQDQVQIIVASEISSYVEANLQTIGRASIKLDSIPLSKLVLQTEEWLERTITASSLRLDVVLSEIYQLSRSKITPFIDNKRVKVNWKIIEHPAYQLQNGDYLSVRGLGRSKIITIQGKTKKDKWRLDVGLRK
ncbi:RNA-binding protein [Anaerobacillus alkalilacustris]|uniref:RNA-binding protein n=1 Tax=Anaerobacillus alkalilacustris TaxID=393763 RepID=A0A1S2LL68_9BACI|nr:RNA-binding protein [Anaerobacillus alkalilacustris]OIJ13242.1 RNA-binding protein [Anaerobacillus alkalilacustris]